MFDNVVVGVGDDQPAARDALSLARELSSADGTLLLIYVIPPEPGGEPEWQADERERALERLAALRDQAQVEAELLCVEARSVADALHEAVRARGDLLVIGPSRRDDFERAVTDVTRAVLTHPPSPVAVAPLGHATTPSELTKIGVAYDGSPGSEQALAVARELAREHDAELSAFEAVREPFPHDPRNVDAQPVDRAGEARARLAELGDDVEPEAATGEAAEELARYAASVDLLVLGSHEQRPFDRLVGSTSQRLADRSPSPLLVLSSAGPAAGA
jgi:nucleotide-binding universal stress UspA family protein